MYQIDKQLREIDINLTISAVLFFFWVIILSIIIYPLFSLLVDNRFDDGESTMTTDIWNASLPDWLITAYDYLGYFISALGIWIILNLIHGICLVIDAYQHKKKVKYQYQFSWRGY
jgi:mannose/fructose/N-acetylgalactosamine-specific phosphotransferase system component IIC